MIRELTPHAEPPQRTWQPLNSTPDRAWQRQHTLPSGPNRSARRTGEPALQSCLYEGQVRHRRFREPQHEFCYRLFMVYLDLSELDRVFAGRWLWSTRRWSWAWFRRADHLGDPSRPLEECVRELVESRLGRRPDGPIRLLTHLRYCGYIMNPVSFYYCFNSQGQNLDAVVAEVNNTPWGERHCYVLDAAARQTDTLRVTHPKEFHVSPFLPMDLEYRWTLTPPGKRLFVHIDDCQSGEVQLDATLQLERRPLTPSCLSAALARFPWMTAKVIAGIYREAFRMWWKGAAYHPHPAALATEQPQPAA